MASTRVNIHFGDDFNILFAVFLDWSFRNALGTIGRLDRFIMDDGSLLSANYAIKVYRRIERMISYV